MTDTLTIWTVTHRPRDLPGVEYAARPQYIPPRPQAVDDAPLLTASTLEGIRALLPPGLFRMPRDYRDDPVIVETWM